METHFFVPRWTLQGVLLLPSWTLRDPSSTRFGPILDPTSTPTRPGEGPRQSLAKHSSIYTARPGRMRGAINPPPPGEHGVLNHLVTASTSQICKNLKNLLIYLTPPPPGGRAHSAGRPPMMWSVAPRRKRNIAPFAYTYVTNRPGSVCDPPFSRSKTSTFALCPC